MPHVAGGVATTVAAHLLAEKQRLKSPIMKLIYGILFKGLPPSRALFEFGRLAASYNFSLD